MSTLNDGQVDGQDGAIGAPQEVVINGESLNPTEASELIGFARKTRELEKQYNTSFDKVWPEYGRLSQEHRSTQAQLAEAREKLATYEQKKDAGIETQDDLERAKDAARKLGIPLKEDLEREGYIRKDDLPSHFKSFMDEQKKTDQLLSDIKKYEGEIDGTDGRAKFNGRVVLAYMNTYGIDDPMKAYEDMYGDSLKEWRNKQVEDKKNPPLKTFKSGTSPKEPKPISVNKDNFRQLLEESMG